MKVYLVIFHRGVNVAVHSAYSDLAGAESAAKKLNTEDQFAKYIVEAHDVVK